jgi:uncharacterized membrane protein YqjE
MIKTKIYAIVIGRLLLVGVLLIIRWLFEPIYFLFMILYSTCETVISGINSFAGYVKKLNDELFKKIEQQPRS